MKATLTLTSLLLLSASALAKSEPACIDTLFEGSTSAKETIVTVCELDNGLFRYQVADGITHTGIVFIDTEKQYVTYSDDKEGDTYNQQLFLEHDDIYYGVAIGEDAEHHTYASSSIASGGEIQQQYDLDPKTVKHKINHDLEKRGIHVELPD